MRRIEGRASRAGGPSRASVTNRASGTSLASRKRKPVGGDLPLLPVADFHPPWNSTRRSRLLRGLSMLSTGTTGGA